MKKSYHVDENGYYGTFGGAYIPEMLFPNTEELRTQYLDIMNSEDFQEEFHALLKDYVGRPTPLYFSKRLSELYRTKIYLKREDLCHTGAHKVNNTIGQILMAKRLGENPNYCRDRRRTARGCHSYCLCPYGDGMRGIYGRCRH